MNNQEFVKHIKERENVLLKELEALRTLLELYTNDGKAVQESPASISTSNTFRPKGNDTWEDYAVAILEHLDKKSKANEVANVAIAANPNLAKQTVINAIKGKLSKLNIHGTIMSEKGEFQKDGYLYFIKQKEPI